MDSIVPERFPPVPQTQALNSTTFRPPPVDGSLSLPEMYDWHLKNSPNHPLMEYTEDDGSIKAILWSDGVRAVHRTARIIRNMMGYDAEKCPDTTKGVPVIAVVSGSDTITYFTLLVGIQYAGFTAFPISPRNSPEAIAHFLSHERVDRVLVGREQQFQVLVNRSLVLMKENHPTSITPELSSVPVFEDLYTPREGESDYLAYKVIPQTAPAMITHSSGSTAYPKIIAWTAGHMKQLCNSPFFGEQDLTGKRVSCHSLPMYHSFGIVYTAVVAACGLVVTAFKPRSPAAVPAPQLVFKCALANKCDIICCVPIFVEAWARNPAYVQELSKLTGLVYGGGPLNKDVGDYLVSKGVPIICVYGSSETGIISPFFSRPSSEDWEYFPITRNIRPYFSPDGFGNAELVIVCNEYVTPPILNTVSEGIPAYATSDLLTQHPTKPIYWKVHGRLDDQIMHSTGEKTNPVPLESNIDQDPHIRSSVIFGRGRVRTGIVIDPSPEYKFDPTDTTKVTEYIDKVWPTMEKINAFAPRHSRIFKEMILIATPSKPFTYTVKNTPRRHAVINEYMSEIDKLYADFEEHIVPPDDAEETVTGSLRDTVLQHLDVSPNDFSSDTPFTAYGLDSLSAARLAFSLQPFVSVTQIQLLSDLTFAELEMLIEKSQMPVRNDEISTSSQFNWQVLNKAGDTLVKLNDFNGIPLILVHGAAGNIIPFKPLQERITTPLWALQMTPDTPMDSVESMVAFYFQEIKKKRPEGPYRIGGYSGASVITMALAHVFQTAGDQLLEVVFLDHTPPLFFSGLHGWDDNVARLKEPTTEMVQRGVQIMAECYARDATPARKSRGLEFHEALTQSSLPVRESLRKAIAGTEAVTRITLKFIVELAGSYGLGAYESIMVWCRQLQAPTTVCVALRGIVESLPVDEQELWKDHGAKLAFTTTKVIYFEESHFSLFDSVELVQTLEQGWSPTITINGA